MQLVKAIRESKPALRREDWMEHIKQYERIKSQLNRRRMNNTNQSKALPIINKQLLSEDSDRRLALMSQQMQRRNRGIFIAEPENISRDKAQMPRGTDIKTT